MMCVLSRLKRLRVPMLGLFALLFLLTLSACGGGSAVEVYDNARVLNVSKVQNAASNLPNPVAIYTTNTFRGTQADFQRVAMQKLNGNPNLIVMAIDTGHRYLYIARGSNVPLSSAGINQAVSSFSTRFNNGDYTSASVAALQSMRTSLNESSRARASSGGGLFSASSLFCCIVPLLLILFLALFAASRRGRIGGTMFRGNPFGQRRAPLEQPPEQGPYPEGPQQGRGINPWMAGGLGAAAGGLAGYELGRRQGEGEPRRDDELGGGGSFGGENFGREAGGGGSFGGENFGREAGGGGSFGGNAPGGDFGGNDFGGGGFGGGGSFGGEAGGGGSFGGDDFDQGGGGGNF